MRASRPAIKGYVKIFYITFPGGFGALVTRAPSREDSSSRRRDFARLLGRWGFHPQTPESICEKSKHLTLAWPRRKVRA